MLRTGRFRGVVGLKPQVFAALSGDCSAGDQVTLLSAVFSRQHDFAGVPAIFATVRSGVAVRRPRESRPRGGR
jgi:hypothetical protein